MKPLHPWLSSYRNAVANGEYDAADNYWFAPERPLTNPEAA